MTNDNGGIAGSDDSLGSSTRVGTAEREEAIALLAEHWLAGRLDPGEHERRVTRAREAVTRADLDTLFADLPRPGPAQPGPSRDLVGAAPASAAPGRREGKRDTIMALTPFAALVIFFLTGSWLWFLMIPVMGILLYGPEGQKKPGRKGHAGS